MGPNQSMQNTPMASGAPRTNTVRTPGARTAQGTAGAMSATAPASVQGAGGANDRLNGTQVFRDTPKKKSHATLFGMILLALLAAGGIGFGVWAYLDGNARVAKLNDEITSLKAQLAEQTTTNEEVFIENGSEVTNTENYIYVGEWGIKIAKPDNWRDSIAEYSFANDYPQAVDTLFIKQISDADNIGISISNIGSTPCENQVLEANAVCTEINGENYTMTPVGAATEEFVAFFTDPSNYSAINSTSTTIETVNTDAVVEDTEVEEEVTQ